MPGCEKPNDSMGLCAMHAYRLKTYGTTGPAESTRPGGPRVGVHGGSGYKRGCRCEKCREAKRLTDLAWRSRNRDKVRDRQRRYRHANADRVAGYRRTWKLRNPDKVTGWDPVRAAAVFDAEAIAYASLLRSDPCSYCGGLSDEIDHIAPVSKSRSSAWDNLTAACTTCNRSKGAKPLLAFLLYAHRCRRQADLGAA